MHIPCLNAVKKDLTAGAEMLPMDLDSYATFWISHSR
jgi:hypothetical protein